MAGRGTAAALAVLALAGAGCKGEPRREIGLAGGDAGAPVVIVDRPTVGGGGAVGPLTPEVEPNDQRDQARPVGLPGGIDGALSGEADIDFYRIEPGPARVVSVRLSGPDREAGGADLVLDLYDGDGKAVARSDRGPAGALEGLPNAPLAQGAAYFVSVSQFVKKGGGKRSSKKPKGAKKTDEAVEGAAVSPAGAPAAGAPATAYQLTIETVAIGPADEVEPNEQAAGAREVLLAEEQVGFIGWSKDQDVWKLSVAGFAGGFVLDVTADGVEGAGLVLELLGPDGQVLASRVSDKGRALLVRGFLPGPHGGAPGLSANRSHDARSEGELGAQHYIARLGATRSNPSLPYRLRTASRSLEEGQEAEPNDDAERAIAVGPIGDGAEGERRGFLDGGDTDFYRFDGGREPLGLTLSVDAPPTVDIVLRVLRAGGQEIARADGGKAGQREEVAGLVVPRGEALLVVVSGVALGDETDGYVLRWKTSVDLGAPAPIDPGTPSEAPQPDEPPVEDPYE